MQALKYGAILTTQQMRMAEQYTIHTDGVSNAELMEFAGQCVSKAANKYKIDGGRIVVFVGVGNNAGDGFVAARLLRKSNIAVTVVPLFSLEQLKSDAAEQAKLAADAGVKIRPATSTNDLHQVQAWLKRAVIVVDAIFGTGLTRPLEGWVAEAVTCINQTDRPILSVDIPSGIDSDTGKVLGTSIKATFTLPIAAYKWGHWLQDGEEYGGNILMPACIGISSAVIKDIQVQHPVDAARSVVINMDVIKQAFPERPLRSHKYTFGHLWIFGGSVGYTGAPRLAAAGAQAVGTGLVSIACPNDVYSIVAASSLETMVHPQEQAPWEDANAIVTGPGWGIENQGMLEEMLRSQNTLILDAGALNILAAQRTAQEMLKQRSGLTVLTPHPGEAGRLLGMSSSDIQADRLSAALRLANQYKSWVVLKGSKTLIVSPKKHVWVNPFGSAKLATAGSGDVLAGMLGGLLAQGISPEIAMPAAVGLHGLAGEEINWHRAGQLEVIVAMKVQSFR